MLEDTKKPKKIPGIVEIKKTPISEEESEKRIQSMYENLFSLDQVTEGSRHGNRSFPMYPET